jgi:hypothetical protein
MRYRALVFAGILPLLILLSNCIPHVRRIDAGEMEQVTSYVPAGCDYTVTIAPGVDPGESFYPARTSPASTAPVHVHASFPGDASQGFAVNWAFAPTSGETDSTDINALQTGLLYGTDPIAVAAASGPGSGVQLQWGHTARYSSDMMNGDLTETRIHEVHVCGLQPATTYYYKVLVPTSVAENPVFSLTTAPPLGSTASIRFAVSGDARNNAMVWGQAQQLIQQQNAQFQLFSGNMVNLPIIQDEWDAFFGASNVPAFIPLMTASGNHDVLDIGYLEELALPQNPANEESPAQAGKEWYSFNYGNTHIVVLNDTTNNADVIFGIEADWLDADLSAVDPTKTPWQFVLHSQPEYSCDTVHGSNAQLAEDWGPIYDKHHVDIVFTGDVNNYERSTPLKGGEPQASPADGTLYIINAPVGAPQYSCQPSGSCPFTVMCTQADNFGLVSIAGNTLAYTAVDVDTGEQIDSFTITKQPADRPRQK